MKRIFTLLFTLAIFGSLQAQTLFETDFESGLPAEVTADEIWEVGTAASLSSAYFAIPEHGNFIAVNDDAAGNGVNLSGRVISPPLDLSMLEGAALSFEGFFYDGDYQGADEQGNVLVSNDEGATWTQLHTMEGNTDEWQNILIDLSAYVDQTILVAFEYLDGNGWNYGFAVDDVNISGLVRNDARLVDVTTLRYHVVDEGAVIEGNIQNMGSETITSIDISWTQGGEAFTETVDGLNIGFAQTSAFSHPTAFVPSEAITYDLAVELSSPNGEEDANPADNTLDAVISGVSFRPDKRVVIEEGTGTWCGFCPRGHVAMEYMKENYPETFIGIAVHNQDPMAFAEHDGNTGITGYPGCNADRVLRDVPVSTQSFIGYHEQLLQVAPIAADVSAVFFEGTRELEVEVSAEYVTRLSGIDHRLSVILMEDDVTGTSSSYAQVNYYQGGSLGALEGAGHDWTTAGDPVPASEMEYDDVSRAILGGYNGTAGIIAADVEAGDVFNQTFTYEVPATYNWENMHAVVLVLDGESGAILNAGISSFDLGVNTQQQIANELLDVFPNPSKGEVNINLELEEATDVQLTVYTTTGQQVATQYLGKLNGQVSVPFDGTQLPAGVYAFHLNLGDRIAVKQVVIK